MSRFYVPRKATASSIRKAIAQLERAEYLLSVSRDGLAAARRHAGNARRMAAGFSAVRTGPTTKLFVLLLAVLVVSPVKPRAMNPHHAGAWPCPPIKRCPELSPDCSCDPA